MPAVNQIFMMNFKAPQQNVMISKTPVAPRMVSNPSRIRMDISPKIIAPITTVVEPIAHSSGSKLSDHMISRVHKTKPGCSSCGR
jgi:hypothetical protein